MGRGVLLLLMGLSFPLNAQMVEVTDKGETAAPATVKTGPEKVREYFQSRKIAQKGEDSGTVRKPANSADPRYLALHIGTFFDDTAYKWGHGDQTDIGKFNFGVTYRLGEWINSADLAVRTEFLSYGLDEGTARKLSFQGLITFPDANSKFPLYFGAGLGPGIFFKQINGEGALALDYSLLAGVRMFNVIDSVGFMLEMGLKNHLHLLSDGQFNGIFINIGTVFSF